LSNFFPFKSRDSVTQILVQLRLPSFDTIVHNSRAVTHLSWASSCVTTLSLCILFYFSFIHSFNHSVYFVQVAITACKFK